MNGQDLFKVDRSSDRLNESFFRMFGKKINLENFDLEQLQDARNRLRTQISQIRGQSNFNETVENSSYLQAKMMLDAINAEISERDEHIIETDVEEGAMKDVDYDLRMIANDGDEEELISALQGEMGSGVADVLNDMMSELQDELAAKGMNDVIDDNDKMIEMLWDKLVDEYGGDDEYNDDGGETDDNYALASAGFGSDEDYESINNEELDGKITDEVWDAIAARKQELMGPDEDQMEPEDAQDQAAEELGVDPEELDAWLEAKFGEGKITDEVWDAIAARKQELMGPDEDQMEPEDAQDQAAEELGVDPEELDAWLEAKFGEGYESVQNEKAPAAMEVAPPGAKAERMVRHIKKGYAKDGKLTDKERSIAYATAWKHHNKKKDESVTQGEEMTTLREGEVQQASAIVTAKTMVDRVGRWIEELSGMENETLLQLGDSIRDEMGQEQSRAFIEAVAPAIQSALETLKGTRETISNGVNTLATGEAPANMLGAEPEGGDMGGEEAPMDMEMPAEEPTGDEFAAAEPAAGGAEEAGRQQRESIDRQSRLLKMLAG